MQLRHLVPVAALATVAFAYVPARGVAQQQVGGCDQAIAEAGTGQGTYGRYALVQAPEAGRSGSQVVLGTARSDHLVGGSGDDVLCGLGGDDVLVGGSGHDLLEGGDGSDVLEGGSGNDLLDGGPGFDRHFGGSGNDTLRNGEVNDGGSGRDEVAPAPPVDISASMPQAQRNEITADFQGRGYGQRMIAEGTNLNTYDSAARGGALMRSTPMDLEVPPGVSYACGINGSQICHATTWSQYSEPNSFSCQGCFESYWSTYNLGTIYLAQNNNNIFMAGTKGNSVGLGGSDYQNLLYVLDRDGSCARQSCAEAVVSLPNMNNYCGSCVGEVRSISVTALATGFIGSTPYLAVALSDDGVQIYDVSNANAPRLTGTFQGMWTGYRSASPPTAVAWDPSGSGLLAVGTISRTAEGFVLQVNADGSLSGGWASWSLQGGLSLSPGVLSAAFGQRQDGSPVVAFGMSDGTVRLIDPTTSGTTDTLAQSNGAHGVIAINPIPRFDGSSGGSDFAVSYQTTSASPGPMAGNGGLLRWDGTSGTLTALPVSTGSPNTLTADWDTFRKWYPGIKQGRFQVSNTSGEPITVSLHAAPDSASGCWYAPSWADAPAFPTAGITVTAGQTSPIHTMGAYTAGTDGTCAATNNTDIWRGYLVVTPVNHPADARLVRLRLNQNMTVDVENQAGGATTVSIAQAPQQMAAFGLWTVTVATPAAPTPQSSPTVTGARVTPAETPGAAVYRFDVTGATFHLANPDADQMEIPPLIVEGSLDGTTWTNLGTLVPATAPTIVPQGNQFELQVGPATFWWENPTGQPAYQHLRVGFGSGGPQSQVVTLADFAAPPAPTNVTGPQIAATSSTGVAAPVDSGIDQAPLSVQVLGANNQPLPIDDPSYSRIYYRHFATNTLITNLIGADANTFIGISPYAGAYPNNGSAGGGPPGTFDGFHYVATTSSIDQKVVGYLAINASAPAFSQPIEVHATQIAPVGSSSSAASGISLVGCTDFGTNTCRLAAITATTAGAVTPAVYLNTTSGIQIGLLTVAQATTAASSLPLQHANGTPEHLLANAPLTMSASAATLTDTAPFEPNDRVDTNLVTHGVLAAVVDIPTGS